jgi:hypothetical protein
MARSHFAPRWPVRNTSPLSQAGANLVSVNLRGAISAMEEIANEVDLQEADLTGATADTDTVWPEGFDPVVAGVIFD